MASDPFPVFTFLAVYYAQYSIWIFYDIWNCAMVQLQS